MTVHRPPTTTSQGQTRRRSGPVYGVAAVAALGGLLFGYDTGVISGALLFVQNDFHLTAFTSGVVVSSILVGAMIGALASGPLSDRWGRRPSLVGAAVIFAVGSIIAATATTAMALVAARVVLGLAVGAASTLVPVFISEMSPAGIRGRLVAVNQLMITIGIVAAYAGNYALDGFGGWRAMFAIALVPAAALAIGMIFLSETPRFLVRHGRDAEAHRVLAQTRPGASAAEIDAELADIRRIGDSEPAGRMRDLAQRWVRPALVAGIGLQVLGQATGVNTVIYYAPTIFTRTGFGTSAAILATVGVGVVNVIMTIVGMAVVDRVGRKKLLLGGVSVMAVALAVLAMSLHVQALAFAAVILYVIAVAVSLNLVVFVIPSELYPLQIRGRAMSATLFANWGMNFVVSLTFLSLLKAVGTAGTFWLYAVLCVVLVAFTVRFIPETKGRTLEKIEADLHRAA